MPLYIKDDTTARLVGDLATQRGITKQDAVRLAFTNELERAKEAIPLCERLAARRQANLMPPSTGEVADKAFYDKLSGEL